MLYKVIVLSSSQKLSKILLMKVPGEKRTVIRFNWSEPLKVNGHVLNYSAQNTDSERFTKLTAQNFKTKIPISTVYQA